MVKKNPLRKPMLAAKSTNKMKRMKNRVPPKHLPSKTLASAAKNFNKKQAYQVSGKNDPDDSPSKSSNSLYANTKYTAESTLAEIATISNESFIHHGSSPLLLARFRRANDYRTAISNQRDTLKYEVDVVKAKILEQVNLIEAIYKALKETQFYHQRIMHLLSEKLGQLDIGEVTVGNAFDTIKKISTYVEQCLEN